MALALGSTPRWLARERLIFRFAFAVLLITWSPLSFSVPRQTPLSIVREKAGLAFHTRARRPGTILSRAGQILLSEISDAGERGDWLKVKQLYGIYTGTETQIFNAVMHIAINCSQVKQGIAVYDKVCNLNVMKSSPTFTAGLKLHAALNQTEAVRQMWEEALDTCPLDEVLAGAHIDAAAAAGDAEAAASVLDLLDRTPGADINVAHVTSAIRACWAAEGK